MIVRTDCRWFRGEKPCIHKRLCDGCDLYDPMGKRILVIKLAAMGDVLRTTPLLTKLREEHSPCHITWVVRPESAEMLEGILEIDRLLPLEVDAAIHLPAEEFDLVYCLDKEPAATGLAAQIRAPEKRGFSIDRFGSLVPANEDAQYAYSLGLDDDLKYFRNEKTYQQIIFEVCGFEHSGEDYRFEPGDEARRHASEAWEKAGVGKEEAVVGLNVGAGANFAYKGWRVDGFAELAGVIHRELGARVALLGGEREQERIAAVAKAADVPVLIPGATRSVREFGAIIERCNAIVVGDTLAMHIALAVRRRVVVIFGSTCAQEIELYGRGETIVPDVDCHPCYKRTCDLEVTCAGSISVEDVMAAVRRQWVLLGLRTD